MISKEDFMKVWKDTSRENILNQFYHDYKTLREEYEKWDKLKKWCKETIETVECTDLSEDYLMGCEDILKKMQELEGNNDK